MSERLSRMDRHPSTKKKRRKRQTFKQEWQENQRRLSDTTVLRLSVPENRSVLPEPKPLSSKFSESAPESAGYRPEPRRDASLRAASASTTEAAKSEEQEESEELPPRSVLYPSGRIRLTKWFYETLILLFLVLLGTLLWWGTQTTGVKWPWQ